MLLVLGAKIQAHILCGVFKHPGWKDKTHEPPILSLGLAGNFNCRAG